jgi:copper transport protein
VRRVPAIAVLVVVGALALPAAASGHAILERTEPRRGAGLDQAPARVAFFFNEPVEASFGAVRVFDADGDEVETGRIERPGGSSDALAVALPRSLPGGPYTATYRVISADSHPVSGGFVFTVGRQGRAPGQTVAELLEGGDAGRVTSVAFWAARWLGYLALGLAIGLIGLLLVAFQPTMRRVALGDPARAEARAAFAHRWRSLALGAAAGGLVASMASIVLQGATAAGTSFWAALDPDVVGDVLGTRYGTLVALAGVGWVAVGLVVASRLPRAMAAVPLALVAVVPSLAGHAWTQDPSWLLLPSDVVHVIAMGLWFGGLAALVAALPAATATLEPSDRSRLLAPVLVRFSGLALICVIALASTGTAETILYLNSLGELLDTGFGRAILIKILLLGGLVALGAMNRTQLVPAIERLAARAASPGRAGLLLRRVLRTEVVLVAAVLGVAAALVSYSPPQSEAGVASGSRTLGEALLEYTVDPATAGSNRVHLYLFDAETGAPYSAAREVALSLELPQEDIGPLETDLRRSGPGHYVAPAAPFGVPGDWTLDVVVRVSRFEQEEASLEVPIR